MKAMSSMATMAEVLAARPREIPGDDGRHHQHQPGPVGSIFSMSMIGASHKRGEKDDPQQIDHVPVSPRRSPGRAYLWLV